MATINDYINEIQEAQKKEWKCLKYDMAKVPTYRFTEGKRFFKVIITSWGSNSVHCFVEKTSGDIYMAASWSAPAKGVRGNIYNEKKPLLSGQYYNYR